jgi:hypothetical protein
MEELNFKEWLHQNNKDKVSTNQANLFASVPN